jgi:carboxypeptidase family protein
MFINSRTIPVICLAITFFARAAWADTAAIEGSVKDANGKSLKGADIRIEASGGSSWFKLTKTDANGHYAYTGLTANTYRVNLVVNGVVKASINNVKLKSGNSTNLNFDLQKNPGSSQTVATGKKKTHHVYVPGETGSNFGGRWVEVEDGDQTTTSSRVTRAGGSALGSLQGGSGHSGGQ